MTTAIHNLHKGSTTWITDSSDEWLLAGCYDPEFASGINARLDDLADLDSNWDSYGAPPIDRAIIAAARAFVSALPEDIGYQPHVAPMSNGNLQFEWHHGKKTLELEFESPQTIRFLQWDADEAIEEEDTFRVNDIDRASDLIRWFMSGICP